MSSEDASKRKKPLFIKPPFKRPAAATKARDDTDATDLFSRSKANYHAVVEEEEKRIERRAVRTAQRNKELRKREGISSSAEKRQRFVISSSSSSSSENEGTAEAERSETRSSPCSPPQAKTMTLQEISNAKAQAIVAIRNQQSLDESKNGDSQETIGATTRSDAHQPAIPTSVIVQPRQSVIIHDLVEEEDDIESDEELAEIARQARAAAEKKRQQSQIEAENAIHSFQHGDSFTVANAKKAKSPTVFIFVESPLPGADRKTFKQCLDRRVRNIRLAWCDANGYSEEEARSIILVFRGARVFDANTPTSLGISIDSYGDAYVEGDDSINPSDNGDIVMEAIKEDNFDAYAETWARNHGMSKAFYSDDDDERREDQVPVQTPEEALLEQKGIKIICRAKDYPDFKVVVKGVCFDCPHPLRELLC